MILMHWKMSRDENKQSEYETVYSRLIINSRLRWDHDIKMNLKEQSFLLLKIGLSSYKNKHVNELQSCIEITEYINQLSCS
jgi:hypothetical protein